jgi:3-hydroxyisobutyrate dehydrogenase
VVRPGGEALLLARRAGIDLDVLRQTLATSAASTAFVRDDLGALLDGDYLTSFGLDRCCEELTAIADLARELRVPSQLTQVVEQTYQRALRRFGPVDGELLAVALLEEEAGLRLRARPSLTLAAKMPQSIQSATHLRTDPTSRSVPRSSTITR